MSETANIDGHLVAVEPKGSILEVARRTGVRIPTLCHDPRVSPSASCRLCVVKIEGRRLPVASCNQELQSGMVVTTRDPELEGWRRTILRLALSENPGDGCVRCAEQGLCELHSLAREYGVEDSRLLGATSDRAVDDSNPFIVRDYTLCIHCYRCTRVCGELEQAHAIVPTGRGFLTHIATFFDGSLLDSPCSFCGQCVQTCPTGALMDRKMLGRAKAEEVTKVRTICPYCGTGCGINLHVAGGKVIGVTPDWTSPASQGSLCVKGQFGMDFIHSPDRLTTPLVRRNGKLTEATWEEAYDLIVRRFSQIRSESGPDAFVFWASGRATNESNYLMQKFARAVIGTNSIDNCART